MHLELLHFPIALVVLSCVSDFFMFVFTTFESPLCFGIATAPYGFDSRDMYLCYYCCNGFPTGSTVLAFNSFLSVYILNWRI